MTPYDRLAYETRPCAYTHPDRLAAIALLHGLEPVPVERCRVLELGCGNGANLLPMAAAFPQSCFVGLDIASVPLAAARETAGALGLENVRFLHQDLLDVDAGLGRFDYVIAHGVYSWVPAPVRDRLLEVCCTSLAPQGVAFVSYNTYPGCHLREMTREFMLYETAGMNDPEAQLRQARGAVDFLTGCQPGEAVLVRELETVREREPWAVYHDDLSPENQPVYFYEFAEHAGRHGLRYLGDAQVHITQENAFPPPVAEAIRRRAGGDPIRKQQYLDFLKCRRFRRTLLCHREAAVLEAPDMQAIPRLHLSSSARPVSQTPDLLSGAEEEFRLPEGSSIRATLPLAKIVIAALAEAWPATRSFRELLEWAGKLLPQKVDTQQLAELLLHISLAGLAELHSVPSPFVTRVSERPRAFGLARLQAGTGPWVCTLRHWEADIQDPLARRLIVLADGTRAHDELLRDLQSAPEAAGLPVAITAAMLEENLGKLASLGILEA